ncbi:PTS system protein [Klebsiella pneumoniae]|uniref:PTS system protein n=1 Tax=Klebsiella pneumoniae TaxID=573 RepID=A0A2X3CYB8_KLEPN|nr:PTS system protein [Klebsiella pneumoniae]
MQRIVLCCAAGMSTSMLVNKMKAEAQQRALALEIYAVRWRNLNANCQTPTSSCSGRRLNMKPDG